MVACELDKDVAGDLMGWKLPAWQSLLLHRVFPSIGGLLVYLTLMCFDLTLIIEHFLNYDEALGVFCTILVTLPSIIAFIFTVASSPSGFQTDLSAYDVTLQKKDCRWLAIQFFNLIFFPVAAIGRYCFLIFWWVEAVCASRDKDEERTQEAILQARSASPMELYLFLQSFIHAAPHAIVNILDLMARYSDLTFDKVSVQAISIVVSCLRMASTATVYRRFEREKICGRTYPWSDKKSTQQFTDKKPVDVEKNVTLTDSYIRKDSISASTPSDIQYRNYRNTNSDMIQFSPRTTRAMSSGFFENDNFSDSDISSDYLPPLSPMNTRRLSPIYDSDDEYVRPITIIDRVAPRRRDTNTDYNIERVEILPPPVMLAPRPGSLALWAEKIVENAESLPSRLSAPPRRKYYEVIQDEPDIPHRVPRSYMRGLEPPDLAASLVHFLGWYAFFVARLLSIACLINFFPFVAIILLFSHYQVMLLFLIVPQASTVRRSFYIFLAFIYFFCLMEFKIRFRHVRVWHVFWIIVCGIEIVVFTGLWASIDNRMHDWWRGYIVKVIAGSALLSCMCFLVYFVILKPRETIVYIKNKSNDS